MVATAPLILVPAESMGAPFEPPVQCSILSKRKTQTGPPSPPPSSYSLLSHVLLHKFQTSIREAIMIKKVDYLRTLSVSALSPSPMTLWTPLGSFFLLGKC